MFGRLRKQYRNSRVLLLADHTYGSLGPEDRERVDTWVYQHLHGGLGGISRFEFDRMLGTRVQSAWRAYAMAALGIPPAIAGESWNLPRLKRPWLSNSAKPLLLALDYLPMSAPTQRAEQEMALKGVSAEGLRRVVPPGVKWKKIRCANLPWTERR
jgi:hypothetical protein